MEDGQNDLNSIQQAFDFFQHFRQGHRPVQTDPMFVQQKERPYDWSLIYCTMSAKASSPSSVLAGPPSVAMVTKP